MPFSHELQPTRAVWEQDSLTALGPSVTQVNWLTSPNLDATALKGSGLEIAQNMVLGTNDGFTVLPNGQGWWMVTVHASFFGLPLDTLVTIAPLLSSAVPSDTMPASYDQKEIFAGTGQADFISSFLVYMAEGASTYQPASVLAYTALAGITTGAMSIQMVQLTGETLT